MTEEPYRDTTSPPQESERQLMRQALNALDTAEGLCQLIEARIQPTDLPECRDEIRAAQRMLADALGMLDD